jgi:hypothetical protein
MHDIPAAQGEWPPQAAVFLRKPEILRNFLQVCIKFLQNMFEWHLICGTIPQETSSELQTMC